MVFPQPRLEDFARSLPWDAVYEDRLIGNPPFCALASEIGDKVGRVRSTVSARNYDQQRPFVPSWMRDTDDSRFRNIGMRRGDIFQRDGTDPFPAGLDDILLAIHDFDIAGGIDDGDIAGR